MSVNEGDLSASIASLAQRDFRPNRSLTRQQVQTLVEQVVGQAAGSFTQFDPVPVDSAIDAGIGWTTFDAGSWIPEGATSAYLYSKATSRKSGNNVSIEFRRDAAGGTFPGAQTEQIEGDQDVDRDTQLRFLPLTSARTFDYRVTGSFSDTSTQWEIKLEGYM